MRPCPPLRGAGFECAPTPCEEKQADGERQCCVQEKAAGREDEGRLREYGDPEGEEERRVGGRQAIEAWQRNGLAIGLRTCFHRNRQKAAETGRSAKRSERGKEQHPRGIPLVQQDEAGKEYPTRAEIAGDPCRAGGGFLADHEP